MRSCRVAVIECAHARAKSEKEKEASRRGMGPAGQHHVLWSRSCPLACGKSPWRIAPRAPSEAVWRAATRRVITMSHVQRQVALRCAFLTHHVPEERRLRVEMCTGHPRVWPSVCSRRASRMTVHAASYQRTSARAQPRGIESRLVHRLLMLPRATLSLASQNRATARGVAPATTHH